MPESFYCGMFHGMLQRYNQNIGTTLRGKEVAPMRQESRFNADNKLRKRVKAKMLRRATSLVGAIVVFITTYALILPAITMSAPVFCGHEEHVHDAACYSQVMGCGLKEHTHDETCYESRQVLSCGREAHTHGTDCFDDSGNLICARGEHIHSEDCYTLRQELVCGQAEHTHSDACLHSELTCGRESHVHTLQCSSDPTADLVEEVYENRVPRLTGSYAENLLAVAESQLGYAESEKNYLVETDGVTTHGYNIYGSHYGAPYAPWNAAFAFWSLEQIGIRVPGEITTYHLAEQFATLGRYVAPEYIPVPGEMVFYVEDNTYYCGVVSKVITGELGQVDTLELIRGDKEGAVRRVTLRDDRLGLIHGYGRLNMDETRPEQVSARGRPASELRFSGNLGDLHVGVVAPAGAFPDGTQMVLSQVNELAIAAAVENAVDAPVEGIRAVDISYWYGGREIEPAGQVQVTMTCDAINPTSGWTTTKKSAMRTSTLLWQSGRATS